MPQRAHQNIQDDSSPDSSSVITSFDELAKGIATGDVSRRKALRWIGGALVGVALASVPGVAWADDRCSEGQTRCGERCVNLKTNERHCGSCSNRCASNQTCCKGRCVNLQRNERHCGSCFNRCAEGQECVNGACVDDGGLPTCPDQPCCCTCTYADTTTGELVSSCQPGFPADRDACFASCRDNAPPGTTFESGFACASPGETIVCTPATVGTGPVCGFPVVPCTSPPP